MAETTIRYVLDDRDHIVQVGGDWTPFACENGAEELHENEVVGRSLWDFVVSSSLRRVYRQLLDKVRQNGNTVVFPYRCDSPQERRYAKMTVTPGASGKVEFVSEMLRSEKRLTPVNMVAGMASWKLTICCSVCGRLKHQDDWLEVEQAVTAGLALSEDMEVQVAYGICPSCRETLRSDRATLITEDD